MRWSMLINLNKCVTCYSCVVKCKQEHFLPPGVLWARILVSETGKHPGATKLAYPVLCNHCAEPKCADVCPTRATQKREDGIVTVDSDKCIGCRYCVVACPYQARTYHAAKKEYYPGRGFTGFEKIGESLYPHQTGTVSKCNFCLDRVDEGIRQGLRPGVDREATPACVITCPAKARYFGDLDDPSSEISQLMRKWRAGALRPEYGTEPAVYYALK